MSMFEQWPKNIKCGMCKQKLECKDRYFTKHGYVHMNCLLTTAKMFQWIKKMAKERVKDERNKNALILNKKETYARVYKRAYDDLIWDIENYLRENHER